MPSHARPGGAAVFAARRLGAGVALAAALVAGGCGDPASDGCTGGGVPSALVTDAALFRVDLYAAISCNARGAGNVASLTRTFPAGTPIVVDAPPGDYAVVVTSYADAAASRPLGSACTDARFAPGARLCLSLALDGVDLGGTVGGDADLAGGGSLDLAGTDLGYVPGVVLAYDTFARGDQKGWGIATDGQAWGASAGSNTFGIFGGQGQVAAGGNATYPANLGPPVTNADVLATASIMAAGARWGAQLRNSGSATTYAAMLDGTNLTISRVDNGTVTMLGQAALATTIAAPYTLRFRVIAGALAARAWPAGSAEPPAWTTVATDATPLGPGYGGLRFSVPGSSYVLVSSFILTSL